MRGITLLLACVLLTSGTRAQDNDVFYSVRVGGLPSLQGELPADLGRLRDGVIARAILDGPGEAYLSDPTPFDSATLRNARILVRAPSGKDVTGLLALPGAKLKFRIPASTPTTVERDFTVAKRAFVRHMIDRGFAGTGHWRHLRNELAGEREIDENAAIPLRGRRTEYANTYELLTGGRAVAENLQLRRGLAAGERDEATVPLDTLAGITVQEFDWSQYPVDADLAADPLAARIPHDQHAIFFPSFDAMVKTLDAAEKHATPALQTIEANAADARTREKYERQLCLRTDALARLLGPKLVDSVAFTGSDPFLREGTDVAVLFQAKDPAALDALLKANRIRNAGDAKASEREIGGVNVHGLEGAHRVVRSFQFRLDDAVVVSNSLAQVEKLAAKGESIADLDEYRFFRTRYKAGDETAFVVVTDAAIRRWCGPKWRIAMSRRVRAAAVLAALEAEQAEAMAKGEGTGAVLPNDFKDIDGGRITLTERGASSSIYGNTRFLTPIAELDFTHATKAEADGYKRWRDTYQSNWSRYFDPIAMQLKLTDDRIFADVTVMPLIVASEYNTFVRFAGDSKLRPGAGDPHDDALFCFAFAFDHESQAAKTFGNFFPSWPGIQPRTNPLRWIGEAISFSIDRDPVFEEARKSGDAEEFLEKNIHRLPVVFHVDVVDPLVAGLFLGGLRMMLENTAPGYTKWTNRKHGDVEYVQIEAGERMDDEMQEFKLRYATLKGALVMGVNEEVFHRAIDRHRAERKSEYEWLGDHIGARAHRDVFRALESLAGDDGYRGELQTRAWKNIPILDEWRRLFPGRDAVALHEKLTGIRLVCPGGGRYVWNDEWKTHESTVFGHAGDPKRGPEDVLPFPDYTTAEFGVTFEKEGIRARAAIRK